MKTSHITSRLNRTQERIRVSIILTGIVTAIICLLALLSETRFSVSEIRTDRMIETTKISAVRISTEVVGKTIVSAIWPF